jgi:serine/threonine protein kinase
MAPEVLRGETYCLSSDVYSFGIVLWEMIARKLPYDELPSSEQIFHEVTAKHARPTIPPHANPDLKSLMLACWHPNPEKRPPFGYIIENLEEITKGQA